MIEQSILDAYATAIQKNFKDYVGPESDSSIEIEFEFGQRWIRVVRKQYSSRSAHSFIEATTGDIYKAASWKTPAKGVRGSVHALTPRVTQWTSAS